MTNDNYLSDSQVGRGQHAYYPPLKTLRLHLMRSHPLRRAKGTRTITVRHAHDKR